MRASLRRHEHPDELRYSTDHEWVRSEDGRVRVGITDYAQDALGDVVFVQLPEVGTTVEPGASVSEVESTKSVSDIYAPVSGTVVEVNADLADAPERLNEDPYGEGWICVIVEPTIPARSTSCSTRRPTGSSSKGERCQRTVMLHQCGHRNAAGANFCSSCGAPLDGPADAHHGLHRSCRSSSPEEEVAVDLDELPAGRGACSWSNGDRTSGSQFALDQDLVTAGRHPDSDIFLDDITVSRRHVEVERRGGGTWCATSAPSTAPTSTVSGSRKQSCTTATSCRSASSSWSFVAGSTTVSSVADRSHLSIGEVLSLLQDEFPDVTISKIRFLESQGLLDPERTPSGYRKFYEPDIDRLRWILRQQRENFLPLKVIKDRLEESTAAGLVVPPDEPADGDGGSRTSAQATPRLRPTQDLKRPPPLAGLRPSGRRRWPKRWHAGGRVLKAARNGRSRHLAAGSTLAPPGSASPAPSCAMRRAWRVTSSTTSSGSASSCHMLSAPTPTTTTTPS